MIRWKLNEVMAQKRIRNIDLADSLDITENSVYRLRKAEEMPRLTPERLNGICAALGCQPGDLLEWLPDQISSDSVSSQSAVKQLTNYCDQILALFWKGYRLYGPGAVVLSNPGDRPQIAYIERAHLTDPECLRAIDANQPHVSAIVLYYNTGDLRTDRYNIFTLTGAKTPPEYYSLYYN